MSEAIGQRIILGFAGHEPPPPVVEAIETGTVGGVILFSDNFQSADGAKVLIKDLQGMARRGRQPPLLVMVDQEGGEVKRISSAPPTVSPAQMGASGHVALDSRTQGLATGTALRELGVNVDLAPVADVTQRASSFLGTRAFGHDPAVVAAGACGFAEGVLSGGVAATFKHFPGLGRAGANTDLESVVIPATLASLRRDLAPYDRCARSLPLVMISSARYPAIDAAKPAVLSPAVYRLLAATGFRGMTVSDAFDTPAITSQQTPALQALRLGLDFILYGQDGLTPLLAHDRLLADTEAGRLDAARLVATARQIVAFKEKLLRGDP